MRLKDSLYMIDAVSSTAEGTVFRLVLQPAHFIYEAHFPHHPVTPGVCIIQAVKELLEEATGKKLCLQQVVNVKFITIISPIETKGLSCRFIKIAEDGLEKTVKTQAVLYDGKRTFAKVSIICDEI